MALANTFDKTVTEDNIQRLERLKFDTQPQWGKMNAPQMLAHVNVAYELAYGRLTPKNPPYLLRLIIKLLIKDSVVNEVPYKRNSRTSPVFLISDERDFEKEKANLIKNLTETAQKGPQYFEGKEASSFGVLTSKEWSNMFQKHLEHHFGQFNI